MALSKLENLYRHVILDHSSHPHNYGTLENADEQIELNNPTCGDVITLQLAMDGDIIKQAKFSGHGCSISTASASMMTDVVIGKTKAEALALAEEFFLLVQDKIEPNEATPRRSNRPERRREIPGPHQMRHFGLEGSGKSDSPRQKRKRGSTSGIPA